jgi:hypothetical protein
VKLSGHGRQILGSAKSSMHGPNLKFSCSLISLLLRKRDFKHPPSSNRAPVAMWAHHNTDHALRAPAKSKSHVQDESIMGVNILPFL